MWGWFSSRCKWFFISSFIISPLMQHHLHWGRRCGESRLTHEIDGSGRIARETSLIKHSMAGNDEFLIHWIPEAPGLHSFRIANKDAFLGVWLKRFVLVLGDEDIG